MKAFRRLALSVVLLLMLPFLNAQQTAAPEGLWQGYDGEWGHVSRQVIALAYAFPPEKFAWRPAPGVRSVSEVFMHIAIANFWLLSVTGAAPMPAELTTMRNPETMVTPKPDVIRWLERSFDAVGRAHAAAKRSDLDKNVEIEGRHTNADGIYLRILVHANEHMGQAVAYARFEHITPPWSEAAAQH